ncbi:MAG TPA: glycine--tRNA ligase subunit beta, partial [Myxococcota bacterium]|nr:glycine--tRNA ligase subunit beta [Myxococcota bacterium]
MKQADLLIEIHTGELPPKQLLTLANAFLQNIIHGLTQLQLHFKDAKHFATPRRLAVLIETVAELQKEQEIIKRGPALAAAFNEAGEPTPATLGFLRSLNINRDQLITIEQAEGAWIGFKETRPGKNITTLLPELVASTLKTLPSSKRMRFGEANAEFVRPIHSIILLYGTDIIPAIIMGIATDRKTRGHRFHAPDWIDIPSASLYEATLQEAHVVADFYKRKSLVLEKAMAALSPQQKESAELLISSDDFVNEITGLVEWP